LLAAAYLPWDLECGKRIFVISKKKGTLMLGLGFSCVEWHGCTHFYYLTHIFNPFVVA